MLEIVCIITDRLLFQEESFCYEGQCQTHDRQCRILWGESHSSAKSSCFEELNVLGFAQGHCHQDLSKDIYVKCEIK